MSQPRRIYDTAEWKRVRLKVLARDQYRCTVRLTPVTDKTPNGCKPAQAVDHIIPFSEGGALLDMANLRAVCIPCNTRLRNMRRAALARRLLGEPAEPQRRTKPKPKPKRTTEVTRLRF